MNDSNSEPTTRDFCAPSLALAFVTAGLAYALPVRLFPASHPLNGSFSPEILNLYCIVGWMGLAHFIYAYYGQGKALRRQPAKAGPFTIALAFGLGGLLLLRNVLGWLYFGFTMWVYFIPHFVRAEMHFANVQENHKLPTGWSVYWFPAICFALFTFALFCPPPFSQQPWLVIGLSALIVIAGLWGGAWKSVKDKNVSAYMILAFFVLGEALVWFAYRKYMVYQFQQGVYVFHIAMASFYHYYRSYDFAAQMGIAGGMAQGLRWLLGVIVVNTLVIAAGIAVLNIATLAPLLVIFDVTYFTLWVGLHQFASDVMLWLKKQPAAAVQPVSSSAS